MRRKSWAAYMPQRRRVPLVRPAFTLAVLLVMGVSASAQVVEKPKRDSVRFIKPLPLAGSGEIAQPESSLKKNATLTLTDADKLRLDLLSHPIAFDQIASTNGDPTLFRVAHTPANAWVRRVATGNPRSPATSNGLVVVGSGSGNSVYGYDVEQGRFKWQAVSKDAGISSIVIDGDSAYYTTWSCTLERVLTDSGKAIYSKYLASTVNTAPEISKEQVFVSYQSGNGNRLSAHDINSGNVTWCANTGDASGITSAVAFEDSVLLSTSDGSLSCFSSSAGKIQWQRRLGMTTAPVITPRGILLVTPARASTPDAEAAPQPEAPAKPESDRDTVVPAKPAAPEPGLGRILSALGDKQLSLVSNAQDPGIDTNERGSSRDGLDYQGARPGVDGDVVYFAAGGCISAVQVRTGAKLWSQTIFEGDKLSFTTPVVSGDLLITATSSGHVLALRKSNGAAVWCYRYVGQAFDAKPALAAGRVLLTTTSGLIVSLPTGLKPAVPGIAAADNTPQSADEIAREFQKNRGRELPPAVPVGPAEPASGDANADTSRGDAQPDEPAPQPTPTKGEWDRREERKAAREENAGRKYEPKPYKRE